MFEQRFVMFFKEERSLFCSPNLHLFDPKYSSVNFVDEDDEKYRNPNQLKIISDDKNYDEIYAASSLTRRDGTRMLFEDYQTFKTHPIG